MKYKKILSTFLAAALTIGTILPGAGAIQAKAAEVPEPVKTYSFENDLDGSTMKTYKNTGGYTGNAVYEAGKTGQAIKLGDYGLQLNTGKKESGYTVSMWIKPSGNIGNNGSIIYIGAPKDASEYWVSFSETENAGGKKQIWSNDGNSYRWALAFGDIDIKNNEWSLVTMTQTGNDITLYVNGEEVGSGKGAESYAQDNADFYIGMNNWDPLYKGLVDEVQIYDEALTAEQVYSLYDNRSAEDIFKEKGFAVSESINVEKGKKASLEVTLPMGVSAEDAKIQSVSRNTDKATISEGVITGVAEGTATIETSVTVGNTTVKKTTTVTVTAATEVTLPVVAKYSMDKADAAVIEDASGNDHNATIVNPDGTAYEKDGNRTILKINSGNSYITLPLSIYEDLTNKEQFTIEAKYSRTAPANAWLFCIGSKPQATGSNYLFYAPYFGGNTPRAGIKNSSSENLYNFGGLSLKDDKYYTVSMVFNEGNISFYINGILVGTPLASGKNMQSIVENGTQNNILGFIGKSCWQADPNFTGIIDEVTIYDAALTESQIFVNGLDTLISEKDILGSKNESLDAVAYDLTLPTEVEGCEVEWASSNEKVITKDGKVTNPATDTNVALTATITKGQSIEVKEFEVVVKALDLSVLRKVVEEAKAFEADQFTADSYKILTDALADVPEDLNDVKSQQEAYELEQAIREAVSRLIYNEDYRNPWDKIEAAAPKEEVICKTGEEETLFTIPEGLENCVTVTYSSDNEEVASYADGKVTAKKEGTAILTMTVTAKYDGWKMEYGTEVTVTKDGEAPALPFVDVSEDDWFYNEVYYNNAHGYMTGKDETHFAPYENLARAQFAVILHRIEGEPKGKNDKTFPDVVSGEWYADAVLWAASSDVEIIKGYTDTGLFGTADNITREQMAVMMYRYAVYKDYAVDGGAKLDKFADADQVSAFAKEAMEWAFGNGIITGKDNGTRLDPQGKTSRAECAIIIMRFMENM